jgi:NAD(P)-dependent dehydrogenase (short-subunit alcohol dehydrogenase family)
VGARVVVAGINFDAARKTVDLAQQIRSNAAWAWHTDVAEPESVARLADETMPRCGAVHILVNNAAIQISKTIAEMQDWRRVISSRNPTPPPPGPPPAVYTRSDASGSLKKLRGWRCF